MWCKWVAKHTAHDLIYVSEFVKIKKLIDAPRRFVVHNALSPRFVRNTIPNYHRDEFIVLMLCNLKIYKGVIEFVQIARLLPQYSFELVLNATDDEINSFFKIFDLAKILLYMVRSRVSTDFTHGQRSS